MYKCFPTIFGFGYHSMCCLNILAYGLVFPYFKFDRAAVFAADLSCWSQICLSIFLLLITIVIVGH